MAVVAKASVRRGEAELCVDWRRARSPGARQRCFAAAHFRASQAAESELSSDGGAADGGQLAVRHGLVKELAAARAKGRGRGEGGEAARSQW